MSVLRDEPPNMPNGQALVTGDTAKTLGDTHPGYSELAKTVPDTPFPGSPVDKGEVYSLPAELAEDCF